MCHGLLDPPLESHPYIYTRQSSISAGARREKRLRQDLRVQRIAADAKHPRSFLRARVQIHALGYFSEMSADPVRDVIHRQRADALEASDLIFHGPVQFIEIYCSCQLRPIP